MRIGIDARPLGHNPTGIGYYLRSLLDELQIEDRSNHYILISNQPIDYDLSNPLWSCYQGGVSGRLVSTLWMQFYLPLKVGSLQLDVFWGTRHHLPLLLPRRIKRLVTIYDVVHRVFPQTMSLPNLLVERMLMRLSLVSSDHVVTVSAATREEVLRHYPLDPHRVVAIHSGVPPLPAAPPTEELSRLKLPECYFLCVGTLEPRKNLERVFRAFELTAEAHDDIHLVIAGGSGWKQQSFMQMLSGHRLAQRIHFTGYVSRSELVGLYRNALALVFPSLYEGFGLPLLEAMACEAPVITSNSSSMPEVAGEAALLVDPRNVDEIAAAMDRLLVDVELRQSLQQLGLQRLQMFSWQYAAQEMVKLFCKDGVLPD